VAVTSHRLFSLDEEITLGQAISGEDEFPNKVHYDFLRSQLKELVDRLSKQKKMP
jgi:hypothetical protein